MKQIQGHYCLSEYAGKRHLFYRVVGDVKSDDGTLVQEYNSKKTSDMCRLDTHSEPKFGPGTSQ